jgi:hypothetical protein
MAPELWRDERTKKETEKKKRKTTLPGLQQLSHIRLDHALWLMAPSFRRGILSLEVDKRLAVTLLQESCGLCKWHRDRHSERGFGWKMRNLSASRHHDTVACTLQQQERDEEGGMYVLVVARVANKIPHACKECRQRVGRDAASSWFERY